LAIIAAMIVLAMPVATSAVEPLPRSILVVDEASVGGPFYAAIFSAFRSTVNANSRHSISIYYENLDLSRFRGPLYEQTVKRHFAAKYADKPIGVIVTLGSGTLEHMLRLRPGLWPDVPVVFAMVDESVLPQLNVSNEVTGHTIRLRLADMVAIARVVVPGLQRIAMLGDALERQVVYRHVREEMPAAAAGLEVIDLTAMPMRELRQRVGALPDRTAIIYTSIYSDGEGTSYPPAEALQFVAEVANRPIVISAESFLGRGGVGGFVMASDAIGKEAARLALRVLDGESASTIPVTSGDIVRPIFDWRQLQRWNVDESKLPAGSEIRYRVPTVWDQYRWHMLAFAAALLLQAALINWLLYERRRRRQSEAVARETMSELAHVNRIATAGELSASIAHEVTQPLTGIVSSANAALRWLSAATPDLDKVRAALTQIVGAGHRTADVVRSIRAAFKKETSVEQAININELISAVLSLVEPEIKKNQIILEVQLSDDLPTVMGNHTQLQQVVLNLIMNAIEAIGPVSSRPRFLRLRTETDRKGDVLVSVEDNGTGISKDNLAKIFTPLFTTKSNGMGMGLAICRSMIEAHQGRIWASSREPNGLRVQFSLPASDHQG
jgi:signal transduction histidine kinase